MLVSCGVVVLKLSRVRFLGRDRWRHTEEVRASAKIAKNRSEQVPPRHRVGTYLAYSSSRRSIASSIYATGTKRNCPTNMETAGAHRRHRSDIILSAVIRN